MVTIEYECETDFDLGLDCPALAKIVAEKVLDSGEMSMGCTGESGSYGQ
ncbi:MAG: hypothetical protein ACLU6Y_16005 [Ruminococcus sp.]